MKLCSSVAVTVVVVVPNTVEATPLRDARVMVTTSNRLARTGTLDTVMETRQDAVAPKALASSMTMSVPGATPRTRIPSTSRMLLLPEAVVKATYPDTSRFKNDCRPVPTKSAKTWTCVCWYVGLHPEPCTNDKRLSPTLTRTFVGAQTRNVTVT